MGVDAWNMFVLKVYRTSLHCQEVTESLQRFTKTKQVSAHNIQVCRCLMGIDAWNIFVSKVYRTSLHCQEVGEIPGYGWAHLLCQENCMLLIAAANESAHCSFRVVNYSRKLHKKHSIRAATHRIDDFTEHYIIRLHVILSYPRPPFPKRE